MDMFAGIFEDLSSSVSGVNDYFAKVGDNIKMSQLAEGSGALGKSAKDFYKAPNISQDDGLIPMGIPGIMHPKQHGEVQGTDSAKFAPYHALEDRWMARIQQFGTNIGSARANPKAGEVNFSSIKSEMDSIKTSKTLKILTEGMK